MPANNNSAVTKPAPRKKADSPVQAAPPATEVANAPKSPQKGGLLDFAMEPFSKWLDFIKKNWKGYYLGLVKIAFFDLAVSAAFLMIMGLVLAAIAIVGFGLNALMNGAAMAAISANAVLLVAAVVIAAVIVLVLGWITTTIRLSTIVFTDASLNGKKFSLRETCWAIKGKVLRYLVLSMAIGLVVAIPVLVVGGIYIMGAGAAGLAGGGAAGLAAAGGFLVFAIVSIYIVVAAILYAFLTQFWQYGFLVGGLGVRDSLKKAVGIVRMRLAEVLVFDVIWLIGGVVFAIPLIAFRLVEQIIGMVVNVVVGLIGNDILILATALIIMVISTIFQTLLGTVVEAFSLPTQYLFWKKVK